MNKTLVRAYTNALSMEVNRDVKLCNYNTESHPRFLIIVEGDTLPGFDISIYDIIKKHSKKEVTIFANQIKKYLGIEDE